MGTCYFDGILIECLFMFLKYRTPLECFKKFFPECQPFFYLPLKIFGCTVFIHMPSRLRSKLGPRAEKCVFIDYTPNKRGYKCYNPQTKKKKKKNHKHVSFVESQSYFGQNYLQKEIKNTETQF